MYLGAVVVYSCKLYTWEEEGGVLGDSGQPLHVKDEIQPHTAVKLAGVKPGKFL